MSEHYSDERLERYAVGSLSPGESRAIDEHFLECDRCCHRLKELAADALTDYLREQAERDREPGK